MRILFRPQVILVAIVAAFAALGGSPALASHTETATVNATVTPVVLSVIVSPTSVAYDPVELNSTGNVPTPGSFTATNNGNITENINIRGTDTAGWTLAGTAGANQYVHKASKDAFGTQTVVLTTTSQGLDTGVTVSSAVTVSLKLDAPTSTTTAATQDADVTVIAVAVP